MGELHAACGDADALDTGTLLLNMALDAPPPVTAPDAMPPVRCPLDAVYAALVAAVNAADEQNAAQARKFYEACQTAYRDEVEDGE